MGGALRACPGEGDGQRLPLGLAYGHGRAAALRGAVLDGEVDDGDGCVERQVDAALHEAVPTLEGVSLWELELHAAVASRLALGAHGRHGHGVTEVEEGAHGVGEARGGAHEGPSVPERVGRPALGERAGALEGGALPGGERPRLHGERLAGGEVRERCGVGDAGRAGDVALEVYGAGHGVSLLRVYAVDDTQRDSPRPWGGHRATARPCQMLKQCEKIDGLCFRFGQIPRWGAYFDRWPTISMIVLTTCF